MSEKFASRIVIDDSRAMLQNVVSLTDDPTSIIYNCNTLIVQATGPSFQLYMWACFVFYAITSIRKTIHLKVHLHYGNYRVPRHIFDRHLFDRTLFRRTYFRQTRARLG